MVANFTNALRQLGLEKGIQHHNDCNDTEQSKVACQCKVDKLLG